MSTASAQCGRTRRRADCMRRIVGFVFIAMLAMLAGCASTSLHEESPALDVVTLNLWHDREDWPHRQAIIEAELRRLSPDAIVLQEVLQRDGLTNQAQALAQRLGYHVLFVSVDPVNRARRYGNAILTREATTRRGFRRLQPHDAYRIAGWVRTTVRGRAVNFYVVHLDFEDRSGATRAKQVADLLDFIDATRGDVPVVIGGDFNITADAPELAPLRDRFVDAFAAAHPDEAFDDAAHTTLNPRFNPPARIDRIYAERNMFAMPQARRILDAPDAEGRWASDHYGVWARLPFAPREDR